MNNLKLDKIRSQLKSSKFDTVFVSSVPLITYFTGFPHFSIEEREAYLIFTKSDQFIVTDPRYAEAVGKQVKDFKLLVRSRETPFLKQLEDLAKRYKIVNLGIEEDNLTVSEYKALKKVFKKISHFSMTQLRLIKSPDEIRKIEKACRIGDLAFKYIKSQIKPGISEIELANKLEDFIRTKGAKLSFETIAAFGKNASVPHHGTGRTRLKDLSTGQFIKLDFGVKYQNYCSDMTRTVFYGQPSTRQIQIYQTVLKSQRQAASYIEKHFKISPKEPLLASEVARVARNLIVSRGFETIPHALGHGIGLEVHEAPNLSVKSQHVLQNGMVFSIEPGIYIPDYGGVRIEDLFVIQNNQLKQLTKSPKELTIIKNSF